MIGSGAARGRCHRRPSGETRTDEVAIAPDARRRRPRARRGPSDPRRPVPAAAGADADRHEVASGVDSAPGAGGRAGDPLRCRPSQREPLAVDPAEVHGRRRNDHRAADRLTADGRSQFVVDRRVASPAASPKPSSAARPSLEPAARGFARGRAQLEGDGEPARDRDPRPRPARRARVQTGQRRRLATFLDRPVLVVANLGSNGPRSTPPWCGPMPGLGPVPSRRREPQTRPPSSGRGTS